MSEHYQLDQTKNISWDIIGISEMGRPGEGNTELNSKQMNATTNKDIK